jgi:hypothetical protein
MLEVPVLSPLNNFDPINKAHPLNHKRLVWWLPTPELYGGSKVYDIVGQSHGTLWNAGWTYSARPGSSGAVRLSSAGQYLSSSFSIPAGSDVTFAVWIKPTAWSVSGPSANAGPGFWRTNINGASFNVIQSTTGLPWIRWNGVDALKPSSGYALPLNTWTRVVYTMKSGGRKRFYANGILRHSNDTSTTSTENLIITAVGYQNNTNDAVIGDYDDVTFFGREWSEADVAEDYNLSRMNYPGVLRREVISPPFIFKRTLSGFQFNGTSNLLKNINLGVLGFSTPPIFVGQLNVNKAILTNLDGTSIRPSFNATSHLIFSAKINSLAESLVPVFSGQTNIVRPIIFLSDSIQSTPPVGIFNANVLVGLLANGVNVIETFVYEDVVYVTLDMNHVRYVTEELNG